MTVKIASVTFDCHDALVVDREERGYAWTLMADPEGNEFDLAKALRASRRTPEAHHSLDSRRRRSLRLNRLPDRPV